MSQDITPRNYLQMYPLKGACLAELQDHLGERVAGQAGSKVCAYLEGEPNSVDRFQDLGADFPEAAWVIAEGSA